MTDFDKSTKQKAEDDMRDEWIKGVHHKALFCKESGMIGFKLGRDSVKESLTLLAQAFESFPGINCDTDDILRWTRNAFIASEKVKASGNWPLPECSECKTGFPINEHGEHYGTQRLGMIPTTKCGKLS